MIGAVGKVRRFAAKVYMGAKLSWPTIFVICRGRDSWVVIRGSWFVVRDS